MLQLIIDDGNKSFKKYYSTDLYKQEKIEITTRKNRDKIFSKEFVVMGCHTCDHKNGNQITVIDYARDFESINYKTIVDNDREEIASES